MVIAHIIMVPGFFRLLTYATGVGIIVQTIVCFLFRLLECHKIRYDQDHFTIDLVLENEMR